MTHGFKEWTLICEALGSGVQSIILRKGGIAEGRAGFRFAHPDFLLLPTLFHEQLAKLKLPAGTPLPGAREDGQLEIRYAAQVEWTRDLTDLHTISALAPFHLWRDEVIEERFHYSRQAGVSLAFVRISRLSEPFVFPSLPAYGGCRSWVELPALPAGTTLTPVLDAETHAAREQETLSALGEEVSLGVS